MEKPWYDHFLLEEKLAMKMRISYALTSIAKCTTETSPWQAFMISSIIGKKLNWFQSTDNDGIQFQFGIYLKWASIVCGCTLGWCKRKAESKKKKN